MTNPDIDELQMIVLLRNNRVRKLRLGLGLTQLQMGRLLDLGVATISQAEAFKAGRNVREILSRFFNVDEEWLFPPGLSEMVKRTKVVKELSAESIPMLMRSEETRLLNSSEFGNPEREVEKREIKEGIDDALKVLSPRERRIFEMYYLQERSLDYISDEYKVTRERIQQILSASMRKVWSICHFPKGRGINSVSKLRELYGRMGD